MRGILEKNKKGIGNQIVVILVMGVILIALMLIAFIGQLFLPPLVNSVQEANTIVQETLQSTGDQDLIDAGEASFQPATQSLNNLEWFSYTIFIVMFLVWIVMCFYVRTYPFLIIFWIILVLVVLAVSIYLTVVYQDLRVDSTLGNYYQDWENTDFFLQNLPVIVAVMGIIGGIVMFMLSSRETEAEGGYPI